MTSVSHASQTHRVVAASDGETVGGSVQADADGERLRRGTEIGRYLVLDRVASGGMGVVYSAYDPELDRRIAIKVLRTRVFGSADAQGRRAILLREARAMASLSHPNVVTVHDVGIVGDEVFLAMELVDGCGLDVWLRDDDRSYAEIVQVFVAAGRGLAAAHEAGIVHRDFKPHNVLVGRDGRVAVTDFGLARASTDRPRRRGRDDDSSSADVGTPAYMAPEQHLGQQVDARADQFSFCVSLYEALYGVRPFEGASETELADAVIHGRVQAPPASSVPKWLQRLVMRGLDPSADQRYPSMEALLAELDRDRAAAWRRSTLIASLIGVAVFAVWAAGRGPNVCEGANERMAQVWDPARKKTVESAFVGTKAPYAADVYETVDRSLDAYARAWVDARTDACEATRVRAEQSESLMDLRMLCLDRHLRELRSLLDLFSVADVDTVEHAVDAVLDLPAPDLCSDPDAIGANIEPPPPDVAGEVAAVQESLARAEALRRAARYAEALELSTDAVQRAEATGYGPLRAQTLLLHGRLQTALELRHEALQSLHAGIVAARASGDAQTEAQLWVRRLTVMDGPLSEQEQVAELAGASIAAIGNPDLMRARLLNSLGLARHQAGRSEDALPALEESVELWSHAVGSDHAAVATPLINLGNVEMELHRYDDAAKHFERAMELASAAVGPRHPQVAAALNNLCLVEITRRRHDVARQRCERALAITKEVFGPDHPDVARHNMNLGLIAYELGDNAQALQHYEPAIEILQAVYGADHPSLARAYASVAKVYCAVGRIDAGMQQHRRALAMRQAHLPKGHSDILASLLHMGYCELQRKDRSAAAAYHEEAIGLGDEPRPSAEYYLAHNRFALAKLLADDDPGRAVSLARQAHAYYAAHQMADDEHEARRWLEAHDDWVGEPSQ